MDENNPILSFYSTDRKPASLGSILGVVILVTDVSGSGEKTGIESGWYSYKELKQLEGQKKLKNFFEILDKAEMIDISNDDLCH